MKREDGGLTPIREILGEWPTPLKPEAKRMAVRPFTRFDQVKHLFFSVSLVTATPSRPAAPGSKLRSRAARRRRWQSSRAR